MQLLTASKLSTVAMLAMAAVLHFSVSAVPMEQAGVEEAAIDQMEPAVRPRPNYDLYKSNGGNPSQKAIEDMDAIFKALPPPDENENEPPPSGDAPQPVELTEEAINHMSLIRLKQAAGIDQGKSELVEKRLFQLADELPRQLDDAWKQVKTKVNTMKHAQRFNQIISASSAWEETVREVYGLDQLEECPYDLLHYKAYFQEYTQRHQGPNPSESRLSSMLHNFEYGYEAYVGHNICRLVVNGAYPWLLRILAMTERNSGLKIFSVLSQLKLFTPHKAFAHDLDELMKLFAAINRADGRRAAIPTEIAPFLMLSTPEIIPALSHYPIGMSVALLLYIAAKQHKKGEDTHLVVDEKNLLETLKIGDINDTIYNYYLDPGRGMCLQDYLRKLTNDILNRDGASNVSRQIVIGNIIDHPSTGLEINQETQRLDLSFLNELKIYPSEVLVSILDLDQFVRLYGQMHKDHKSLSLIVMAGRSRRGSAVMNFVFHDLLGEEKGIKDGVKVDDEELTAGHLAQLVQGCVMACTKENWHAFVDLFVKKVKDTEHLPEDEVSSPMLAQQVVDEIPKLFKHLDYDVARFFEEHGIKEKEEATKSIDQVKALILEVGNRLSDDNYHPISVTKKASKHEP